MSETKGHKKPTEYINPYLGGVLLGLVLLITIYLTGRGLGASGAVKSAVVATVDAVATEHAHNSPYMGQFLSDDEGPLNNWLVFEVLGVIIGAFISGTFAGRLKLTIEHQPKITSKTRLIFAGLGGLLFGIGTQFGRGCTSGTALSGMATLSLAGYIAMLSIFGTAFMLAYFFRKLWI